MTFELLPNLKFYLNLRTNLFFLAFRFTRKNFHENNSIEKIIKIIVRLAFCFLFNYSMYYNNDLFIKTFCVKKLNQNSIIQS